MAILLRSVWLSVECLNTGLVPIVKNTKARINDPNKYRPIAVATIMSKSLKHVILTWCGASLKTSDNRFSFKPNASSDTSVFTSKQLVSKYNDQGSPVFCTFLNASKAFERVCHSLVFR